MMLLKIFSIFGFPWVPSVCLRFYNTILEHQWLATRVQHVYRRILFTMVEIFVIVAGGGGVGTEFQVLYRV